MTLTLTLKKAQDKEVGLKFVLKDINTSLCCQSSLSRVTSCSEDLMASPDSYILSTLDK